MTENWALFSRFDCVAYSSDAGQVGARSLTVTGRIPIQELLYALALVGFRGIDVTLGIRGSFVVKQPGLSSSVSAV